MTKSLFLNPKEELKDNIHVKQVARSNRYAYDENGKMRTPNTSYQVRDGIFEAIIDKFYKDPTLIAYSEDFMTGVVRMQLIVV